MPSDLAVLNTEPLELQYQGWASLRAELALVNNYGRYWYTSVELLAAVLIKL